MQHYDYLIIGGGIAGQKASDEIRMLDPEGSIALVTEERHLPYQRIALSKGYLTGREDLGRVYLQNAEHYRQQRIQVTTGVRATALDPAARRVTCSDGQVLGYDRLLLATGGRARRLPIPGARLPGVFTLRSIEDADAIRSAARRARHALVIGGGFIAFEVSAALLDLGLRTSVVFPETRLLERVVPRELSLLYHSQHEAHGAHILKCTRPEQLEGGAWVERARLDNGQTLEVDLVVVGAGIQLNTELAREAGLELDADGGVVVDECLRTSDPNVYAAGDIAAWPDPVLGRRLRVEHWGAAQTEGLRAGRNMAREDKPYRALPYFFWTEQVRSGVNFG